MRKILFLIVWLWASLVLALSVQMETPQIDLIPEARGFAMRDPASGTITRGLRMGNPKNPALVFTGGYGSNILAYRMWMRAWVAAGFQVFAINTPGFGMEPLNSEAMPGTELGLNNLVRAIESVVDYAYEESGNRPVVLAGHSLGGLIARFASLGIRTVSGRDRFDSRAQAKMRKKLALVAPIMSPSPIMIDKPSFTQEIQMRVAVFALSRLGPPLLRMHSWTPTFVRRHIQARVQRATFSVLGDLLVTDQFLGAPDMDFDEYEAIFPYAISSRVPSFLPPVMRKWLQDLAIKSKNGLNLSWAWQRQQISPERAVPLQLVIGSEDLIADANALLTEAATLGVEPLVLESGHIGAMVSPSQSKQMADLFYQRWQDFVSEQSADVINLKCAASF